MTTVQGSDGKSYELGSTAYTNYLLGGNYFDASTGAQVKTFTPTTTTQPTTAGDVVSSPALNLPTSSPKTPDTSSVSGMLDYYKSYFDTQSKIQQDTQTQISGLEKENKTALQKLMESIKSPADARAEATKATGVNPADYFAEQKAGLAEIGKLNEEYNSVVAAKDQQVAQSRDKLGSNNFINNQIAQIERNAAPRLNQLSSNIKAKAGILEAQQGRFAEAQNFINQAVQDATADNKFKFDLFDTFYSMNSDTIARLDTKYRDALSAGRDAAESAWKLSVDEKTQVGDLMLKYYNSGITINDTLEQALAKIGNNPDPQTAFANANTLADNKRLADGSTTTATAGFVSAKLESEVRGDAATLLDDLTPEEAYKKLRIAYSPSEVTDAALKSLLGIAPAPTAPITTATQTPTTTSAPKTSLTQPSSYQPLSLLSGYSGVTSGISSFFSGLGF